MIDETLKELQRKIKLSSSIPDKSKEELIAMLSELKTEIAKLSKTRGEEAESISGFTKLSTHEATRSNKDQHLLDLSLKGLVFSVEGLEVSHPRLYQLVNSVCTMLTKMGI